MRAYVAALQALAQRRITEAQLWKRLERKGYAHEEIREAGDRCKRDGYLDDGLFARLYVEQSRRPLGDRRLVGDLVRRGIDPQAAMSAVAAAELGEVQRCSLAFERIQKARPDIAYASAARLLDRAGFPASLIYATLRTHAKKFGPLADLEVPD